MCSVGVTRVIGTVRKNVDVRSVIISVVLYAPLAFRFFHAVGLVMLLSV
jgi:hypothetical protein